MAGIPLGLIAVAVASAGFASHMLYFIHGEHHMHSPYFLLALIAAPPVIYLATYKLTAATVGACVITTTTYFTFIGSLTASILTYRLFFHPLRRFPGPFTAKLSKLSHVRRLSKKLNNYAQVDELHRKYGEFVRIGPNKLTILTPEAASAIDGVGSSCTKAPWYDAIGFPNVSVNTTRDAILHAKRRRIWDRGFNANGKSRSLRNYEERISKATNELASQLISLCSQPVNVSLWFNFFSFDAMGDLAFGRTFDMMKNGEQHHALRLLQEGMGSHGLISPIPWIFPIIGSLPGAGSGSKKFAEFCSNQISARKKDIPEKPDIMSWLLDAPNIDSNPIHKDPRWLAGDTRLLIVAGSDTVASTLTFIFYHLASSPEIVSKLRLELASAGNAIHNLQNVQYLNGVINEALRLHPPTPSGLPRQTPSQGLNIRSTFVPGNVNVSVPTWSLGRHAYSCVGKHLAYMELRSVTARLVNDFNVGLAPGEDGRALMEDTKDVFTLHMAPLKLVFTPRATE